MNATALSRGLLFRACLTCALTLLVALPSGCSEPEPEPLTSNSRTGSSSAFEITSREQLIGGKRALGEIGDYMIQNDKVRIVVQDVGFSRGFGVYGGGVIDMDLRRPKEGGDQRGGDGRDHFGEMFPAFFLQALAPERVEVVSDGSDGSSAIIRVTGYGGDFLTLIKGLNQQLIEVFGPASDGVLSRAIPCQFGRWNGMTCSSELPNGEPLRRCPAPGGLVCSAQCVPQDRTNPAGEVVGIEWRVAGTDLRCNPGVWDDQTCSCVNGDTTITEDDDQIGNLEPICADAAGPFCDPGCPDSGVFVAEDGTETPCQRGRFNPESCACESISGGTDGMCASYCPAGQPVPTLEFFVEYELKPGVNYMIVRAGLTNVSGFTAEFPSGLFGQVVGFVPTGDVFLFSAGNSVFAPTAGFDLRRALDAAYALGLPLPALPGFPTDFLATTTPYGVSYGVFVEPSERNVAWMQRETYENVGYDVNQSSMLVPFSFSAFTGAFYNSIPEQLKPSESYMFTKYVIVGDGDVGSIVDTIYEIKKEELDEDIATGQFEGRVVDTRLGQPVDDASVVVYQRRVDGGCELSPQDLDPDTGRLLPARYKPWSQYTTRNGGRFVGTLEAGCYAYQVLADERVLGDPVGFRIEDEESRFLDIALAPSATINVRVVDKTGRPIPAKVTVVGFYDYTDKIGQSAPHEFLFNAVAGEPERSTDLVPDLPGVSGTRRYIEAADYTDVNGFLSLPVRPTDSAHPYTIFVSRGIEYDLFEQGGVVVKGWEQKKVSAVLERVVDTTGYVSTDLHVHSIGSIDSPSPERNQIAALAGEGVEFVASTDHNFINDLNPAIRLLGLSQWLTSVVGVEMTTIEGGHFNGYPLEFQAGDITHGSFEWAGRKPQDIFDDLRGLGAFGPENTIVQVNHPRDSVLGYFDQFAVSNVTGEPDLSNVDPNSPLSSIPLGPMFVEYDELGTIVTDEDGVPVSNFSYDFDAIEIFNGKRFSQIHSVRGYDPADCATGNETLDYLPPTQECVRGDTLPEELVMPGPGAVVMDEAGQVAHPGNVEDWFNLINQGHRVAGVANSDTHHPFGEEPGFPRSFVRLGYDSVTSIKPLDFVNALKSQKVIATNGPFVEVFVNGEGEVGDTVSDSDGSIDVLVRIQTAPWVEVDTLVVYVNGLEAERRSFELKNGGIHEETFQLELERDAFLVAEVTGAKSLFPVVPPLEVPPLLLTDAVGAFGGAFGLSGDVYDALMPSEVRFSTPWAMTNPVFVDADGGGWTALGTVPDLDGDTIVNEEDNCPLVSNLDQADADGNDVGDACEDGGQGGGRPAAQTRKPTRDELFRRRPGNRRDLRALIDTFGHNH